MDFQKRLELIKRNTIEIVTEKELHELLEKKKQPVLYHGFEPSGKGLHIGNILAINKHMDFQNAGLKLIILLADFHAWLNEKGSVEDIKKTAEIYKKSMTALGVDAKKSEFVLGSSFQLKPKYFSDVMKLSLSVRMLRARRSMTLIGREEEDPHISQVLYPLMQVEDIKALNVDIAFGDMAQRKVHMLARENLPGIGFRSPIAIHHEDMIGLQGGKMSSSIPKSHILVNESPESIEGKISEAYCPAKQNNRNPILQICEYIIFGRQEEFKVERSEKHGGDIRYDNYKELEKDFTSGKLHPLDLKKSVSRVLIKFLEPARKVK